jgi:cell division protein FtsW
MSTANRPRPTVETVLVASVGLLCALGVVMVQSASSVYSMDEHGSPWTVVVRHGTYLGIGLAAAFVAARTPLHVWRDQLTLVLLVVAVVCLVVVQVPGLPFTPEVNGATRWIRVGPLGFQPSDLAKLALVLWLARFLAVHRDLEPAEVLKRSLLVLVPLAALVMLGDDLGTTLLLAVIFVAMLFLAGAPLPQLAMVSAGGVVVASMGVMLFDGFRMQRIMAFLHPDEHADRFGYQVLQSRIGFASGGVWGLGPGSSRVKWGYLPEAHTDFILAVVGEELGLIGTLAVLGCLVAMVGAAIVIGLRCDDLFGRFVAWGIAVWLAVQALINVGVSVGALPTKGIPLPFVSYGGTSMVVSLLAVGVLFSVSRSVAPATARAGRPPVPRSTRPAASGGGRRAAAPARRSAGRATPPARRGRRP